MEKTPDRREEPLISLVCEMEERLRNDLDSGEIPKDAQSSVTPDQAEQLELAKRALRLLQRAREKYDTDRQVDSATLNQDSTQIGVGKSVEVDSRMPRQLGRFEIQGELGQGSFSRVFLAHDPHLDRQVALKIPKPTVVANEASRKRFRREAQSAARLSHPAIVPIYESGELGPVDYIAYGYCSGKTLSEWVSQRDKPVDVREAARMMVELAEAVEHAHRRGITHRDLKPANILIESPNDDSHQASTDSIADQLRITDFGLAKLDIVETESLTMEGAIVGTPAYMSPEQARGDRDVGPGSDIFSLGTIFYELLTGHRPFLGPSYLETMQMIQDEEPNPIRRFRPNVPRDLEAICLKCLRKSPSGRYDSAQSLAADLNRWLNGQPIIARRISPLEKFVAWTRRNPMVAAAVTFAFAALGIGMAAALWQRNVAVANLNEMKRQTERAEKHLDMAQDMIRDISLLGRNLQHSDEYAEVRGKVVRRAAELQLDLMNREIETPDLRVKAASSLNQLSPHLIELGENDQAIANIERVLELLDGAEHSLPKSAVKIYLMRMKARMNLENVYRNDGRLAEAEELLHVMENDVFPEGASPYGREVAKAIVKAEILRGFGDVSTEQGNFANAIEQLENGLAALNSVERPDIMKAKWDIDVIACRLNSQLVDNYASLGDSTKAFEHVAQGKDRLASLRTLISDSPHIDLSEGQLMYNAACACQMGKQWSQMLEFGTQSYEAFESLQRKVPKLLDAAIGIHGASERMVEALVQLDRLEEARELAKQAIEEYGQLQEDYQSHPDIVHLIDEIKSHLVASE